MTKSEIIRQAKHYFGKNRRHIKKLVLSYEFNGKSYRNWKKEISNIISNPFEIRFKLFEDVILWIKGNQSDQINWNWIGDLSWTIDIVLNPNIDKVYDLDKKLAAKCNGTSRILKVFISDVIACYTYDFYYMTYNKIKNYYEFGPITKLTKEEKKILKNLTIHLEKKGFVFVDKSFTSKKYKELFSDKNSDGNASLFDVLFSDINFYTTETKRFCDKQIIEKSGTKLSWTEIYDTNGKLKERTESRWTTGGDYFKIVMDNKAQIIHVGVIRKEIDKKKYQEFKLDIIETFKKRKKLGSKKKNSF